MTSVHKTSNPFEQKFGYYRAVRRGPFIAISGSTSVSPDSDSAVVVQHIGDAGKQTCAALGVIFEAVQALGGKRSDILKISMFVQRPEDAEAVAAAMAEMCVDPRYGEPGQWAAKMIVLGEGGGFVDKDIRVEVEADAYVLD